MRALVPVLALSAATLLAGCAQLAGTTAPEGVWEGNATGAFMDGSGNMVGGSYFVKFEFHEGNITLSFPGPGSGSVQDDGTIWARSEAPGGRVCTFTGETRGEDWATGRMECTQLPGERSKLVGEWWAAWEGR